MIDEQKNVERANDRRSAVERLVICLWQRSGGWKIAYIPFLVFIPLYCFGNVFLGLICTFFFLDMVLHISAFPEHKTWKTTLVPGGGFLAFWRGR